MLPRVVEPHTQAFQNGAARLQPLLHELHKQLQSVRQGGGAKAVERHHSRGKL